MAGGRIRLQTHLIFDIGNKQGESGEVKDARVSYSADGWIEGYVITSPLYVNIYQKGADVRMYFAGKSNSRYSSPSGKS